MKIKHYFLNILFFIGFIFSMQASGAEKAQPQRQIMELDSEVQGQRSQPKVLFILPWEESIETKDIDIDDSLISEEDYLAPIDRVVFQHRINMYKQLDNSN